MFSKILNLIKDKTRLFATMISSTGIIGTLNTVCVSVLCGNNTGDATAGGASTLWNTEASDGLLTDVVAFYMHWWWVAAIIEAVIWVFFTWIHNEKAAEVAKRAIFITIGVFLLLVGRDIVLNTIEAIAGRFGTVD